MCPPAGNCYTLSHRRKAFFFSSPASDFGSCVQSIRGRWKHDYAASCGGVLALTCLLHRENALLVVPVTVIYYANVDVSCI